MVDVEIPRMMGEDQLWLHLVLERLDVLHDIQKIERVKAVIGQVPLVRCRAEDGGCRSQFLTELSDVCRRALPLGETCAHAFTENENVGFAPPVGEERQCRPGAQNLVIRMRSNAGGALDAVETEHQTDSIIASGMAPDSVFVGGVDVSRACLEALCAQDLAPVLVVGYGPARQAATGVADMEAVAREQGIEYVGADDINAPGLIAGIEALDPAVMFVIGWSQLVRRKLLDIPARGSVGIHPTALPEGRGRAPIPWTIIKGLRRTASTMFYLTEGVDDGDVIGSVDIDVDPHEDAGTLYAKHRDAHVTLMHRHARDVLHGTAPRTPQDHDRATTWERRRPEDGRIDPSRPVSEVGRLVRAVTRPFPGAFLELEGERLLVWRAEPAQGSGAPPGVLDGDLLSCADGALRLLEVERCQLR